MNIGTLIQQGKDITTGHVKEFLGLEQNLSELRIKICKACPLYKSTFGGQCNSKLYLNPKTGDVSDKKKDGYYKGCGCRLLAKTRLNGAKCPAHKW